MKWARASVSIFFRGLYPVILRNPQFIQKIGLDLAAPLAHSGCVVAHAIAIMLEVKASQSHQPVASAPPLTISVRRCRS